MKLMRSHCEVRRIVEDRPATGLPRLVEIVGPEVVDKLVNWLELRGEQFANTKAQSSISSIQWPDPISKEAYRGRAGEIVAAIEPHTEADSIAILGQLLVCFGSAIGRTSFFRVESDRHFSNLFTVLVGETSKARKGTSWKHVEHLFNEADPEWTGNCVRSGVSTGEGLIWNVRDPVEKLEPVRKKGRVVRYENVLADGGVADKRLLALESEFAQPLKLMSRDTNILSSVIRQAWDSGNLRILTKTSPGVATDAHIALIGHVTRDELCRYLNETEQANGFANRIVWLCVRRSKLLPEGGMIRGGDLTELVSSLRHAVEQARKLKEIRRDDGARTFWKEIYPALSEGKPGLLGALTSRAEAQVTRLSMIYALIDRSKVIRKEHLESALALWRYSEASVRFIFGDSLGDPLADEILSALRKAPEGLTRTAISDLFQRHRSSSNISQALQVLIRTGRAICQKEATDGRSEERWHILGPIAKYAKEA